jgi:hypothetical protein
MLERTCARLWWPRQQKYQILRAREQKSLAQAPCLEWKTGADARIRKRKIKTETWPNSENWWRKTGSATWCSNPRANHKKTKLGQCKRQNLGTLDSTPSWKRPWRTARELRNWRPVQDGEPGWRTCVLRNRRPFQDGEPGADRNRWTGW